MRLILAVLALLFAFPAHADSNPPTLTYDVSGNVSVPSNASCACPETISFSFVMQDVFGPVYGDYFGWTILPGAQISATGPLGPFEAVYLEPDGIIAFTVPSSNTGLVSDEIDINYGPQPGDTNFNFTQAILWGCISATCQTDFPTNSGGCCVLEAGTFSVTAMPAANGMPEPSGWILLLAGLVAVALVRSKV